ncbi:MAG: Protein translocase subunit SecD, partial [Microgenomates group bacterium Gr01-1014_93]
MKRYTLWLIIILTLAAIFVDLPKLPNFPLNNFLEKFPLKLGLDLQGGSQLILQTDMKDIPEDSRDGALESARSVIERRVNLYGVS